MAGEEVLRAFFAVELDDVLRREAGQVAAVLRERIGSAVDVRWTRPEGWHVTLRFLGNVARTSLTGILDGAREALATIAPFELRLGAAIAFPPRRARVLAIDLAPHAPLVDAAGVLEQVAVAAGLEPEARAFRPHLTLGRIRRGGLRARQIGELTGLAAAGTAVKPVSEIVLFRSELHRSGARYTPLERIALGSNVHP